MDSSHKGPVTRKMFPSDDVIMMFRRTMMASWHGNISTITVTLALCQGNPPVTGGYPSQRASKVELRCFFVVILDKLLTNQWTPGQHLRSSHHFTQRSWYLYNFPEFIRRLRTIRDYSLLFSMAFIDWPWWCNPRSRHSRRHYISRIV